MTTLWKRFKYTINADLHNAFDKKEQENPIAMLNQYVREAEKQTEQTGKWIERQSQLKGQLEKELLEAQEMLAKRTTQMDLARQTSEGELIDFAQAEVAAYANRKDVLQASILRTTEELFGLEQKYEEMKHKVKDMKVRQLQLMGKENVTRAHHQMDKMLQPESSKNADKRLVAFDEMEQYIERLGQRIEKQHDVSSMERRLEMLEKKEEPKQEIV
ncbi:PspA/IM30 family protein [Paenisporosarcina sp. TG-14]|uniref:PspA/IM30 family protein n=1 Tax=Paenisporosarcina sp. TG-14 TaxID=1231057 RepID=UPI0002D9DF69|nr:PspA/IM30 family protein [Paenisporosarcina sp. TG-14]